MKIVLAGAGFLGSLFALEAAKRAFALKHGIHFWVYDPDVISLRNVANQAYSPRDATRAKAPTLASVLRKYQPVVKAIGVKAPLLETSKIKGDILVCAVDNIRARNNMWILATRYTVPLLSLGVDQVGGGDVSWYVPNMPIDDVPFSPIKSITGPPVSEEVVELPPCELITFRGVGHQVAVTGAQTLFHALGYDPEKYMGDKFPGLGGFSRWYWRGTHFEFGGLVPHE